MSRQTFAEGSSLVSRQTFAEGSLLALPENVPSNPLIYLRNTKYDEIYLHERTYHLCLPVFYENPLHVAIRRYIVNNVMQAVIEISDENEHPKRARYLRESWFPHLIPALMNEIWLLGLVVVRLEMRDGLPYPQVFHDDLGIGYRIGIVHGTRRSSAMKYHLYIANSVGLFERSRNSVIFGGFGYDPDHTTGGLRSVVAALLSIDHEYMTHQRIGLIASANMARPMVLTQTKRGAAGAYSREDIVAPFYGGQDHLPEDQRRRMEYAADDLDLIGRQQQAFWDTYMEALKDRATVGERSMHQAYMNVVPLPPDHESANYQTAHIRTDWHELQERYETLTCVAYGIQRAHIINTPGRLQVNESLADMVLITMVNNWREHLSRVLTSLVNRAFPVDKNEEGVTITMLPQVRDTMRGLQDKYAQGLLTWNGLRELTMSLTGIDEKYLAKKPEPRLDPSEKKTE